MKQPQETLEEWGHAYKVNNFEYLKSLYAEGSVFELRGSRVTTAKAPALKLTEFDDATGTKRALEAKEIRGEKVRAEMTESSDWLRAAGIDEARYDAVLVIREGRIQSVSMVPLPETRKATERALGRFVEWARKERPERLAQAMPGGRIRYNAEAGRHMIELMHEWRQATG